MPNYRTHLCGGIILCCVMIVCLLKCGYHLHASWAELLAWCAFGSIFPDIDTKSKVQQLSYCLIAVAILCCIVGMQYRIALFMSVISFIPIIVHHRGIFHQGWFLFGITVSGALLVGSLFPTMHRRIFMNAMFFLCGALSHIMLDGGWRVRTRW